ncbi:MAG: (Fe-S)-binding protein [Candidatus Thorarchaeota archaeon]
MTLSGQSPSGFLPLDTSDPMSVIYACYQCGSCTGVCPLRKVSQYNPRAIIHASLLGHSLSEDDLTDCLTCRQCYEVCPQQIDFPLFIQSQRAQLGVNEQNFAHHNIFNLLQDMQSKNSEKGMEFEYEGDLNPEGNIAYFPGCIDLFDRLLDLEQVDFHQIGQSAINLINKAGIEPNLVSLKCCGHDAFWSGDNESFKKIRSYNEKILKKSGIAILILSCAECYYSFKELYQLDNITIQHISEFIVKNSDNFSKGDMEPATVTYHDPCRLGRYLGEYDNPREAIKGIDGITFTELPKNRGSTQCCGVSAWMKCDDKSRYLMLQKLEEATKTGASTLTVSCTKCFAHLNCVLHDKKPQHNFDIQIKELGTLVDEAIPRVK